MGHRSCQTLIITKHLCDCVSDMMFKVLQHPDVQATPLLHQQIKSRREEGMRRCKQLRDSSLTSLTHTRQATSPRHLNEHAPYKRGVARSFHGDNFNEKSGGVSPFVARLPLNSHCSNVLWIQESYVVTLSCLAVGSLWLVSW